MGFKLCSIMYLSSATISWQRFESFYGFVRINQIHIYHYLWVIKFVRTFFRMIGLGAWGLKIFHAAASDRNTFKIVNLIVFAIGAANCLGIIFDLHKRHGLCEFKQFISWITLSIFFGFFLQHCIQF